MEKTNTKSHLARCLKTNKKITEIQIEPSARAILLDIKNKINSQHNQIFDLKKTTNNNTNMKLKCA